MRLARVFTDYMVLQRQKPILIWGSSQKKESIEIRINGAIICTAQITEGEFSFLIPEQEAAEDVTLDIGDIRLSHVDIGELWVAGGQSNMEFMMQYEADGEREIASADDSHLRTYIVGQYSFPGEREEGYKAWHSWDRWLVYCPEHAAELPAVAVYFAKQLRKNKIPVGILSCNWGGTSASAWISRESLLADKDLKTYIDDFEALTAKLDMERFYKIQKFVRPVMAGKEAQKKMGMIMKTTYAPAVIAGMMAGQQGSKAQNTDMPTDAEAKKKTADGFELSGVSMEEIMAIGPGDKNEPSALYENMLREIIGYSIRGVIWYQGESDDKKPDMYAKLFTSLIACWRKDWKNKNAGMERIPFLFVQLAPFGVWMNNSGEAFPELRRQQEMAAKIVPDVYMTCAADIGNVYDIHPKVKKPIGQRLALLAEKYIYGKAGILADAPEAQFFEKEGDTLRISFKYGDGLYQEEKSFDSYNGFGLADIRSNLIPPVLGGVNGLRVIADGCEVFKADCRTENDRLIVQSEELQDAEEIRVEFAQTGFYQVNLFNRAHIPVKPFVL